MFVNREDELAALQRWWRTDSPAALVWGRRRVGKTALLQRFAVDRPAVFHTGAGRPAGGELAQLSRQVHHVAPYQLRDLLARPYADWDDALDGLAQLAAQEPLLVVLDEFPELALTSPELPGVLRAFLDRAAGRTQLRLLLCGSAVRHMEALQEQRAPLYGRFGLSLQVHPFRPSEGALLLPRLSATDRATVYGLLGGMPLYLSWWDQDADLAANLLRLACRPGAPLLTEGQLVLATETERGEYPSAVLHAIAAGRTKHGEIRDALRAEPTRTLERLVALRLVERVVPVTDAARSRRVHYRVADNFLAFWLHVLARFRAEIERGLGEAILPVLLEGLPDFLGPRWEEMFRTHLRVLAARGEFGDGIVAVGPWWSADGTVEIDAVALAGQARTPVLAGEAKWAARLDATRTIRALSAKVGAVPGADPRTMRLALCARERVDNVPDDVLAVTAEDIMATTPGHA
ncbi:MAG: ATP-binding protein [Pseudonocardiaceae bacterium]